MYQPLYGEQISIAKFSILLNELGYKATSLTGWQVGISTNSSYTNAKIKYVKTNRIYRELKNNDVVVVAGFQGIDDKQNITTLGRNGSDTTAISLAIALKQHKCYIFTDIDGVYNKDPNKYTDAKKINKISYDDMNKLAENGAKVLHDRCIKMAQKNNIKIIVKSTFNCNNGTIVG